MWISPTDCCSSVGRDSSCVWVAASLHRMQEQEQVWQADTTICSEQQMPTFDIAWISYLNGESKWAYFKFVQAGACCPSAIHKHLESTIKARRKWNVFFFRSPSTGHLCSRAESRGGGTKNSLYWADTDGRCSAFPWDISHQCKNPEPEQILADSKMAKAFPAYFTETEFSSKIFSSCFSTEQREKPFSWWGNFLASQELVCWQCCSAHITAVSYSSIPG